MSTCLRIALVFLFAAGNVCFAEPASKGQAKSTAAMETSLNSYLQKESEGDSTERYKIAYVDLNGDGVNEAIVFALGSGTCGSGGCNTLVLNWNGAAWSTVSDISITNLPIRLLATKSHGWTDIGVMVHGGGIIRPYEAVLKFNGKRYPGNPTVPPAKKAKGVPKGRVLIDEEKAH